jgi:hypothetical protein
MKPKIASLISFFPIEIIVACMLSLTCIYGVVSCAMTQQQLISSGVQAIGTSYGSFMLTKYNTPANPQYLANYETLVPKVYHLMQGAMTPADFHLLIGQIKANTTPDAKQAAALGFLASISKSFVQYNGGTTPTADGALADAECKQLAQGLADAVGVSTGTNWTPDFNATTAPVPVAAILKPATGP